MANIIQAIIFALALSGSIYFISGLIAWFGYKIAPQNYKKKIENKEILKYNIIVLISIVLWTILFYLRIS